MKLAATIVSRIFDPFAMLALLLILMLWKNPVLPVALALFIFIPVLLLGIALRFRIVSDWDVRNRKERPKVLWTVIVLESIFLALLWRNFTVTQQHIILFMLAAHAGFSVITHVWKISGHMMAVTTVLGLMVMMYGWRVWPLLGAIPLVAWARVVTHNHTRSQVIAGMLYAAAAVAIASRFI